jgi:hypothetical protein
MVIEINKKNCHANQPIKWLETRTKILASL